MSEFENEYEAWLHTEPRRSKRKSNKPSSADISYKDKRKEAIESKRNVNTFQEIVLELMNERGLKDADVIRGTGLAWTTWHEWISGKTRRQIVDENLFKVMKFFNCHLEYLCFGIGDDEPLFKNNP